MAPLPPQRAEREALCDLMLQLGPDAPTLCAGWTAADLAVHLVVRERKPLAAAGILVGGPLAARLEREMARYKAAHSFEDVVATIRRGPPPWWVPVDPLFNLNEYFVHHEDLRRGGGDTTPRPEEQIADVEEALWRLLRRGARLLARGVRGAGLDLVRPDGTVVHAKGGTPLAVLRGRPGELVLFLTGRTSAAHVELSGPQEAVARVREASFAL